MEPDVHKPKAAPTTTKKNLSTTLPSSQYLFLYKSDNVNKVSCGAAHVNNPSESAVS